ncbi:SDR family NAD(P)-dependent oxidoreductase [Mariniblastus fucicola]|uniref:2-(S)-hydroxypropyl-CoM dehydrogenase n=1 Tax=Mariniblastus fucicola TaxID=980251 RepID=A0A5B9PHK5_9BACT|nr:SDR family oxidoreductase [Mariniblastus fucicola]QEG24126.1 2-(S)-hydroxypropyl-CoM dehydrogenase [Mariniblastus fucicola]
MSEKNFIVVGGSKGIGLGITKRLSAAGHQVIVLSRSALAEQLPGVTHHVFDVTTDDVDKSWLPNSIDGVAYCPGSINLRSFRSLKPEIFREDFELNVVGAVKVLQATHSGLKKNGASSVLLFSTVAVAQGMHAHASIAASKGAIEGLTRTLAAEFSPHTRVNCLAPALTDTPLTEKFFADPEKAKALGEKYPLGRTGSVDDLAEAGAFLLSQKSSWITGQVWGIDGGMSSVRK